MARACAHSLRALTSVLLACLMLALAWGSALAAQVHPEGTVAFCHDGDTFRLRDRRVVRLAGIDAPEVSHKGSPAQYYARQSRDIMQRLATGQKIYMEFPGVQPKDRHGRLIANVILPDGQSLNEELVSQGAAFFYPHRDLGPEFQQKLKELQEEAIRERRGMWDKLLSLPLANATYVGNRNSMRFYPADCPDLQHVKPRNQVHFGTLMDAFMAGYAPARTCVFWPTEQR